MNTEVKGPAGHSAVLGDSTGGTPWHGSRDSLLLHRPLHTHTVSGGQVVVEGRKEVYPLQDRYEVSLMHCLNDWPGTQRSTATHSITTPIRTKRSRYRIAKCMIEGKRKEKRKKERVTRNLSGKLFVQLSKSIDQQISIL
eukprot:TRINITY_DN13586_c1_g1_i2.p1 TRINITY_DN13586_c1_g1~~TRINITY_DN13586_c1_g1_i2.p1  ORF type:complete len:140 (+),score=26.33 TRINITY_DN13586_c1_g1_i2:2-421(+)